MRASTVLTGATVYAVLVLCFAVDPAQAASYYIYPDQSGDFPTIQAAIDGAQTGDVILLGDGRFRGEGNRALTYRGKAITIRSLSRNAQNCIIDCESAAQGFVFISGEGASSILREVTITNGSAGSGGAMYVSGASPTIIGCRLIGNHAGAGGAVYT
jgi:hypothetical protein